MDVDPFYIDNRFKFIYFGHDIYTLRNKVVDFLYFGEYHVPLSKEFSDYFLDWFVKNIYNKTNKRICFFIEFLPIDTTLIKGKGVLSNLEHKKTFFNPELRKEYFPDLKIVFTDPFQLEYISPPLIQGYFESEEYVYRVDDLIKIYSKVFYNNPYRPRNNTEKIFIERLIHTWEELNFELKDYIQTVFEDIVENIQENKDYSLPRIAKLRDLNILIYFSKTIQKEQYGMYVFLYGGSHFTWLQKQIEKLLGKKAESYNSNAANFISIDNYLDKLFKHRIPRCLSQVDVDNYKKLALKYELKK